MINRLRTLGSGAGVWAASALAPAGLAQTGAASLGPWTVKLLQVLPPVAAQAVFVAPMDTMRRIKRDKSTGDLTPVPYTAMVLNGVAWMTYGLLQSDFTIALPNVSAVLLGAYYVRTFHQHAAPGAMTVQYAGMASFLTMLLGTAALAPTETAISVAGLSACGIVVVMFSGPLAVIRKVIEKKDTSSLPLSFTLASTVNCMYVYPPILTR